MNLAQMLEGAAERYGPRTAIVQGDVRLSYAELNTASDRFAGALKRLGIKKGDRVAILLSNSPSFVSVYFGIVKLGAVAVLLDPKYKPSEITALFDDCKPRVLVSEASCLEPLAAHISGYKYLKHIVDLDSKASGRFLSYAEITDSACSVRIRASIKDDDLAHIAYTSGPSLSPRGVRVPHGNLMQAIKISAEGFRQTSTDVVIQFALPMHHVIGLVVVMLTSLYCGSKVIILPGISIESLAAAIARERVTIFMGVPFIHALVIKKVAEKGLKHTLGSLRICASAGDILPARFVEKYRELLGLKLINFYGLTESMAHVTCEPIEGPGKIGSVGPALPGWQIRVVDETGRDQPTNQCGEVIISGPVMPGYYHKPEATREVLKEGWLYTGDVGMLDADGYLYILGLEKDMLICKGQNIFPSDIEHILSRHPAVAQVAVFGVPDEMRGEVVGAAIVLKPGLTVSETALKKLCLEHLANYKVPKYFAFRDELPLNDEGEINKLVIKEYFAQSACSNNSEE